MDYLNESARTASDSFHGHKVSKHTFLRVAMAVCFAAEQMDTIKKAIFYGKDSDFLKHDVKLGEHNMNIAPFAIANGVEPTQDEHDIIHAIIGKVTEAGELMQALVDTIQEGYENKPFDLINVREEVGDGLWYDAMLLRAIGSNFDEAMQINIDKLRARFPNKFTEYDANNRDLVEERKILENK